MEPLHPPIESQLERDAGERLPLYSTRQICWTSYLGGPLAGALVLALTLRRLGRAEEVRGVYTWGGLAMLASALAALVVPTDFPNAVIPAGGVMLMGLLGERRLGRAFRRHAPQGKATASFWKALGASLAALPASLLVLFAVFLTVDLHPMNRWADAENEIYYEGLATRADAERLAGLLRERRMLTDRSAWSLTLEETGDDGATIGIIVPDEAAEDEGFIGELDAIRKEVRAALYPDGGVRLELRNWLGATIRRIPRAP